MTLRAVVPINRDAGSAPKVVLVDSCSPQADSMAPGRKPDPNLSLERRGSRMVEDAGAGIMKTGYRAFAVLTQPV